MCQPMVLADLIWQLLQLRPVQGAVPVRPVGVNGLFGDITFLGVGDIIFLGVGVNPESAK